MQRSMVAALVLLALAAPARAERQADRVIVHGEGFTFGVKEPPAWRADLGHAPRFGAHILFYQTKHALRGGATLIMVRLSTSAANDPAQDPRSWKPTARSWARSCCSRRRPSPPASVPNPKSVTKFGGGSTTLAALLLLGIAPTIPRRRALPAPPIHPRLWQRTSGPGH